MRDIRTSEGSLSENRLDKLGERSIRNISVGHRKHVRHSAAEYEHDLPPDGPPDLPRRRQRRGGGRFWIYLSVAVGVCALLGLLLSTVFAGATITVYPRTETVPLPATLEASSNPPVGMLAYKTITTSRTATISVPASGVQKVSRPASGVITVSNAYNTASQRLIANTRFQTADGKIYRVRDSITVPGTTGSGSTLKPGTVSATVYADSPGPEYNQAAGATFTIPGFKGDPRYAKFSAKAEGGITGGFVGDEPAIAAADLASAKTTLQQRVDAEARAAAASEIPEGYVAIPGTLEVVFAALVQTPGADKTATLSQSATATGVIVSQSDLASAIARQAVSGYRGESVAFGDASSMDVTLSTTSKRSNGAITLALKGQTTLLWQFDQNAIVQALVGKSKSEFETVIQTFEPAVAKADASIRPFWQGKFPSDANKIKIKIGEN